MQGAGTKPEHGTVTTALSVSVAPPSPDRFLHSDPHDFAGLYIRHRSSLLLHARAQLNDVRDADEVVQDAFLRLFLALPELETELQALAYCRRTITNLCIDRYRATQRRPRLVALDSVADIQLVEDDPSDPVVQAEDAAIVRAALSQLSPLHREALVKREIEEKTLPVIAVELEIPEESVKHVLFRARRALRRILVGTSVAPGAETESVGLVQRSLRDGGRVAALVGAFALALGLSAGPDLRMVPVVGHALPDLPSLVQVTAPVGDALGRLGGRVLPAPTPAATGPEQQPAPTDAEPEPAARPQLGKSPATEQHGAGGPLLTPADEAPPEAPAVVPAPGPAPVVLLTVAPEQQALATSDIADAPVTPAPAPGVRPSPVPSGTPAAEPTATPEPTPTATATATATAPATASPTATPTGSPSPTPSGTSPSPTATPTPTSKSSTVGLSLRRNGSPTSAASSQ